MRAGKCDEGRKLVTEAMRKQLFPPDSIGVVLVGVAALRCPEGQLTDTERVLFSEGQAAKAAAANDASGCQRAGSDLWTAYRRAPPSTELQYNAGVANFLESAAACLGHAHRCAEGRALWRYADQASYAALANAGPYSNSRWTQADEEFDRATKCGSGR